jgi:hypothetical protein
VDNELRKKRKEVEKLQSKIEEGRMSSGMNKSFDVAVGINRRVDSVDFEDLMNTSIDMITSRI